MPDGMLVMTSTATKPRRAGAPKTPNGKARAADISLSAHEIRTSAYEPVYRVGDLIYVGAADPVWQNHVGWDCLVKYADDAAPTVLTVCSGLGGTCEMQFVNNDVRVYDPTIEWVRRIEWVKRQRLAFMEPPTVKTLLDLVRPVVDARAGGSMNWARPDAPEFYRKVHGAVVSAIGARNVAMILPLWKEAQAVYSAEVEPRDEDTMGALDSVLEMFVAAAEPSGPDCVEARIAYVAALSEGDDRLESITANIVCSRLPGDLAALRSGSFRGELFNHDPLWIDVVLAARRAAD